MKSSRRRLTLLLLGGLFVIWVLAACGIYFSQRHRIISDLDAKLTLEARSVKFAARGNDENAPKSIAARRLQERLPEYDSSDGDAFFQIWNPAGETEEKSASLGDRDLPWPGSLIGNSPVFKTAQLSDDVTVRLISIRAGGPGKAKGKSRRSSFAIAAIGLDATDMQRSLSHLMTGLLAVGLIVLGSTALLVNLSLRVGLAPIRRLAREAGMIDTDTLDSRFDGEQAPSELQPIYAQLNELIGRLEEGFDRERRFSADLAHELRTPIAELRAISEFALKWPEDSDEDTREETFAIAEQMESIVDTLLTLARAESGHARPDQQPVDLGLLVDELWEPLRQTADERDLLLTKEGQPPVWTSDKRFLRHIIGNLLGNGVSHAPNGAQLGLAWASNALEIRNPAPDFPSDQADRVFDRLWRADRSRTGNSHSGLGLSLARTCANILGLELTARHEGGDFIARLAQPEESHAAG
ncbi:MAG: histidine kinase dimerization/phospho-acceptor domain-containing protein [Verrucomicrobiota bacterium]